MEWDPEIDTPATIFVIGGGPVGVEAALYARFLGYSVMLFDQAKVGDSLLRWGDAPIGAAWSEVTTPLGLAALEAQGVTAFPKPDEIISYRQFVDSYLLPVARTDLLYDAVQINSPVVSVSRLGCPAGARLSLDIRAEREFRVLVQSQQRGEYSQIGDIVLDCSGLGSRRLGLASGAGLAVGELDARAHIAQGKIDVLGKRRADYLGKHTILWGNGVEACANAIEFASLATQDSNTKLTWGQPKSLDKTMGRFDVPESAQVLLEQSNALCNAGNAQVVPIQAWGIESLARQEKSGWLVRLQVKEDESIDLPCDQVINCSAPTQDWQFALNLCDGSSFAINPGQDAAVAGLTSEPHYYLLGRKSSCGDLSFADQHAQIRNAFGLIGGRKDLDLYATVKPQVH